MTGISERHGESSRVEKGGGCGCEGVDVTSRLTLRPLVADDAGAPMSGSLTRRSGTLQRLEDRGRAAPQDRPLVP